MWRRRDPTEIVSSLADLLVHLMRLDLVYVRLDQPEPEHAVQALRPRTLSRPAEIAREIRVSLGLEARGAIPDPDGGTLRLARGLPGIDPKRWFVVAGSRRADFPTERESFLLRVAVEQAAVTVENARLYHETLVASKAKSDFIATMSHELRTPLNAILGYVDLLLSGVPEPLPVRAKAQVERVKVAARHLLKLIEEILLFSGLELSREEVRLEAVQLSKIIAETATLIAPLARARGLEFHTESPEHAVVLQTDPARVRQILVNLLSNAVKFTDEGEISLCARVRDARVLFEVCDTGIGISPEHLEKIFEPFQQIEQGPSRREGGTGLGLSVSRRLAQLLGGDVTVESKPGQGSKFTLQLPLRAKAPKAD
jgi:signal transduction histidine kinase